MVDIEGMFGKEASVVADAAMGAAVGYQIYMLFSASCLFTAGGCVVLAPLLAGGALVGGVMAEQEETAYEM